MRWTRPLGILMTTAITLACAMSAVGPAAATPAPAPPSRPAAATQIPVADRDRVLPAGWRASTDRAVTIDGDMTGLHVLVADERAGYAWRTAATLAEPGVDTDQWIGQSCVTASGRRAVVVYAPRQLTNDQDLFGDGALAAVVDLDNGAVTKLPDPVSIAYYDPGCGTGESAVLTEELSRGGKQVSRLITVDTTTGRVVRTLDVPGQITSAVPTSDGIVAAAGHRLVRIDQRGGVHTLVPTDAVPFRLAVDGGGGIGFETQQNTDVTVHRYAKTADHVVLTAPARSVRLTSAGGRPYLLGPKATTAAGSTRLPSDWRAADLPVDAELSSTGAFAVDSAVNGHEAAGDTGLRGTPTGAQPVQIVGTVLATSASPRFLVQPQVPARGLAGSPAVARKPAKSTPNDGTDPSTTTIDPNRACAIPRNDPTIESLQPTAAMAEWAADLAVKGALNVQRPAGYNGSSLPAYTPQGLFPSHPLSGGGQVPAQVLLGIMAQESNMWQASPHAVDGESGNFEQGGFYGLGVGIDSVNFSDADCGYGAMQVTSGMAVGDTTYTPQQQLAITVDYAANIAAGLEILQDKWNQMRSLGVIANNGDPKYIENWWFALWAYNTGWHAENDPNDPHSVSDAYGLGWGNNVDNEDYPADRMPFLDNTTPCQPQDQDSGGNCIDAKHPNDWSYPERVMGFAKHSLVRYDYQTATYGTTFLPANWAGNPLVPGPATFCTSANQCDTNTIHQPSEFPDDPGSNCLRDDLACYWHSPATWISDYSFAGTELLRYQPGSAEPTPWRLYNPDCSTSALPSNALIIDDVPTSVHTQDGCQKNWTNHGTLTFKFGVDDAGDYPAKIDFHQLDGGFGGHFWFAHAWSNTPDNVNRHGVTGTWTLNQTLNGWARVLVYIPDHGAGMPQADYTVHGSDSTSPTRTVTEGNYLDDSNAPAPGAWHSLGAFHFTGGTPSVSLDNLTHLATDGNWTDGEDDIPWDAIAFQPLSGKPTDQIVAMGDSYSSGEGATSPLTWDYYRDSDHDGDTPAIQDACHRSSWAWPRQMLTPDNTQQSVGVRADTFDPTLDYHMTACSGAVGANVLIGDVGQYNEGSQIDQGYLDQNTTVVTISLGGNDARFQDILTHCVEVERLGGVVPCQDTTLSGDNAPLSQVEPDRMATTVMAAVQKAVQQIHAKAPNARIEFMGYPEVISKDSGATSECVTLFGGSTIAWFTQMVDGFAADYQQLIGNLAGQGIDVRFINPIAAFSDKGACGSPEDINELVTRFSHGETPQTLTGPASMQSFHPNIDGTLLYGQLATADLKN